MAAALNGQQGHREGPQWKTMQEQATGQSTQDAAGGDDRDRRGGDSCPRPLGDELEVVGQRADLRHHGEGEGQGHRHEEARTHQLAESCAAASARRLDGFPDLCLVSAHECL